MNKKLFKRYNSYDRYWATFAVVSDGEITPDPEWKDEEDGVYPEFTIYQCHNPYVCVEDYMEKQRRLDELRDRVYELKTEQGVLLDLLRSKLPCDQPILFGEVVVTMDEDGVILFQKAMSSSDL